MFIFGKIIGGLFGLLLAGPLGALVGIIIGHTFDDGLRKNWQVHPHRFHANHQQAQRTFFTATFLVMGHLAKCDGRVSEHEIRMAQTVMNRMGLSASQRREARDLFTQGKQADFMIDPILHQLHDHCGGDHQLLQLFINIQLQAAYADGQCTQSERQLLQHICQRLGLANIDYDQFETFYQYADHRSSQHGKSRYAGNQRQQHTSLAAAYQLLGIQQSASNVEVKRAYRRQMSQHHPDKLVSKGLPAEMIKLANEKTQQIKQAYEQIKQARGC